MLSSLVFCPQCFPDFVRLLDLESIQRTNRQLLSACTTEFVTGLLPLRMHFYLVWDLVYELLFPLTHDGVLIIVMPLYIQLLIKGIHAQLKVVELEE